MSNQNNYKPNIDGVVEGIVEQAITKKSSDVHIYSERGALKVRLRVDGDLYPLEGFEQIDPVKVISEIKVMAELNIMEKRLPQDGHLEFSHKNKVYDFRVSTTPTIYGEAVVMRMINRDSAADNLESLGFSPEQLEVVQKIINNPFGIVLVTGPTGSGKTTLLYAFLNKLNRPSVNILTLEDPVEYQMNDVRQTQVNESIGWDFAKGMRAVIRQDPDIIMVGEIRDEQTSSMAFQAALIGRLVFSTFHTFDIPGIIIRLIEMGIPRSVISHSLTGVISARLIKKICPTCSADFTPEGSDLKKLGITMDQYKYKKGKGCNVCNNSGYLGRIGIFEVVSVDDEMKHNIMQESSSATMSQLLGKKNYITLRQSGLKAVENGLTTPEELLRVLGY